MSIAAVELHHGITEGHAAASVGPALPGTRTAAFSVAVPVAVTVLVIGGLQVRPAAGPAVLARCAVAAVLVLLAVLVPSLGAAVLLMGGVAVLLVVAEIGSPQAGDWSSAAPGRDRG